MKRVKSTNNLAIKLIKSEKLKQSGKMLLETSKEEVGKIPKVPVRTGLQTLNVNHMTVLVQAIAKFSFIPNAALEFTEMIANNVFGQSWVRASADLENQLDNLEGELSDGKGNTENEDSDVRNDDGKSCYDILFRRSVGLDGDINIFLRICIVAI